METPNDNYSYKDNFLKLQAEHEQLKKDYDLLKFSDQTKQLYLYNILRANLPGVTFYWMDRNSTVLGCNQMQAALFGLSKPEDFIGKDVYYLGKINGWDKSLCDKIRENDILVMQTGKTISHEEEVYLHGEKKFFLSYKTPLKNEEGDVLGVFGFSVDITDQKNTETLAIKAKEAAEAANNAKTEFLRNMSHDLRTPLSGIIGMADLLITQPEAEITKDGARDMHQAGVALLNLLNEIIETAQLESGSMTHQKSCFSLKEIFDSIASMFAPAVKQKGIVLTRYFDSNIPDILLGEALLLHRIILNLLGNAVKFTNEGSITLEAFLLEKNSETAHIKIVITDSGIGIPENKLDAIFEKFTRLTPSYSNNYKGSGLGLYIVKEFVQNLGGNIQVNSIPGKGSTFTCTVPFSIPTAEEIKQYHPHHLAGSLAQNSLKPNLSIKNNHTDENSSCAQTNDGKLKVLLVEDTFLPRKVSAALLQRNGLHVFTAETAEEAIAKSKKIMFDLIFMDIGLPDGNGIDVAKSIRKDPDSLNRNTFIAVLTAHLDSKVRNACLDAGVQEAFEKPMTEQTIQETVKSMEQYLSKNPETNKLSPCSEPSIIDIDLTAKLLGDHPEMVQEVLAEFFNIELPQFKQQIIESFDRKDWSTLRQHVHKLHGALCYIGVKRLKEIARFFEKQLLTETHEHNETYQILLTEIEKTMTEYKKLKN